MIEGNFGPCNCHHAAPYRNSGVTFRTLHFVLFGRIPYAATVAAAASPATIDKSPSSAVLQPIAHSAYSHHLVHADLAPQAVHMHFDGVAAHLLAPAI